MSARYLVIDQYWLLSFYHQLKFYCYMDSWLCAFYLWVNFSYDRSVIKFFPWLLCKGAFCQIMSRNLNPLYLNFIIKKLWIPPLFSENINKSFLLIKTRLIFKNTLILETINVYWFLHLLWLVYYRSKDSLVLI